MLPIAARPPLPRKQDLRSVPGRYGADCGRQSLPPRWLAAPSRLGGRLPSSTSASSRSTSSSPRPLVAPAAGQPPRSDALWAATAAAGLLGRGEQPPLLACGDARTADTALGGALTLGTGSCSSSTSSSKPPALLHGGAAAAGGAGCHCAQTGVEGRDECSMTPGVSCLQVAAAAGRQMGPVRALVGCLSVSVCRMQPVDEAAAALTW